MFILRSLTSIPKENLSDKVVTLANKPCQRNKKTKLTATTVLYEVYAQDGRLFLS